MRKRASMRYLFFALSLWTGAEQASAEQAEYKVTKAQIHEREAHGKMFEFSLDRKLSKDTYCYKILFKTKNQHEVEGNGILTSSVHFFEEGPTFKENVFLFNRRHDPKEKWTHIEKEIVPGNIESVSINISRGCYYGAYDEKHIIAAAEFKNL